MRRITVLVIALGVAAALAGLAGAAARDTKIALVAYSTPKEAFSHLIPAFQATPAGKDVSFTQSYGASGDQARAIVAGLPADVVDLSLAPDVDTLVKAGLIDRNWSKAPYNGMVSDSVVVFVLRNGNPKHIKTWDDLVKPGVQVVTPNPFTSGGARWNVMAAIRGAAPRAQDPGAGDRVPQEALPQRRLAGHERAHRAADVHRRQGRRPADLRERGDPRAAGQPARLLPDPEGDAPDREPGRRHEDGDPRREGLPHVPATPAAQTPVRPDRATARSTRRVSRRSSTYPAAAAALHDQLRRRLGQGHQAVLRPEERRDGKDRAEPGGVNWRLAPRSPPRRGSALAVRCRSASASPPRI